MLVLTRKSGQAIEIDVPEGQGGKIRLVMERHGGSMRARFFAPPHIEIRRAELVEKGGSGGN